MTNNPGGGGAADLGSAAAHISFQYDRSGFLAFVRDANAQVKINQTLAAGQQTITAASQAQAQAITQTAAAQQAVTGSTRSLVGLNEQLHRAQLRYNLAAADGAGKVRLLEAEYNRLEAATHEAGLAQDELTRRQIAAANAQTRLQQATNARERGLGPALPRTFAGFSGSGLVQAAGAAGLITSLDEAIGKFAELADQGLRVQAALDSTRASLGAMIGDQTRANVIMDQAAKFSEKYGFTQEQTAEAIRASSQIIRNSQAPIEDILGVLARLQVLSPEQGLQGAALALRELASGDIVSLVDRFEVSRKAANGLKKEIAGGADAVQVLGRYLDSAGITDGALEAGLKGAAGQQRELAKATEDLGLTINNLVTSSGWRDFLTGLIRNESDEIQGIQRFATAVNNALQNMIPDEVTRALGAIDQFFEDAQDAGDKFALEILGGTGIIADYGKVVHSSTAYVDAYTAAALNAAGAQKQMSDSVRDGMLALQQGRLAGEAAGRASQSAINTENLQEQVARINQFKDDVIEAGQEIDRAATARNDRLDDLEQSHADQVADLTDNITDAQTKGEAARTAAVEKGAADRRDIEESNAAAVQDLIDNHRQSESRLIQDQAIADARSQREFDQSEQQAQQDFAEQRQRDNEDFAQRQGEAESAYRKSRQDIIDAFNETEVEREEDKQRELATVTREAQVEQFRSTASFLERLYGMTRGRRNKAQLEEGKAALEAAKAEAAELAKVDPRAAAALLAERQRQILARFEREAENKRLRRAARRGGSLGSAAVEDEIAAVNAAIAEADQATIEGIKTGAKEAEDARQDDADKRRQALDETLSDLDQNYADQKQKAEAAHAEQQAEQDAAFAEQRRRAAEDRAEMLADQEADRKREKQRRDADYAAQLQDLKDSNKDRLDEFDAAQRDRIAQIDRQTVEQVTAIKSQLSDVDDEYVAARKKVNDDYDIFIRNLNTKLQDSANQLDMLPEEARQRELANAYGILGDTLGAALVAGIQNQIAGALGAFLPGAGGPLQDGPLTGRGPGVGDRNPANDPRLTREALRRLFGVGATLGSTFDSPRPEGQGIDTGVGTPDLHGGLDIQNQNGTPFRLPFNLLVTKVARDQFGPGWTVQGTDDLGNRWLFAHFQALARGIQQGERYAKGSIIGYVGSGHTHVQERNQAGVVIDPTEALERAARASGGLTGQSASRGAAFSSQALGMSRMDLPRLPLPVSTSGGATTIGPTLTVDLSGSTFGAGVSPEQIRAAVEQGGQELLAEYNRSWMRGIEGEHTRGTLYR